MARAARESGIPVRELFDRHPLPMWVHDLATLAILAVNAAAVRHYGYSRREFLAMTVGRIHAPDDLPAPVEKTSRGSCGPDVGGTRRHRKKDGTIFTVEVTTHAIRFAGRKAALALARDVTEHKRLEQGFTTAAREWRKTFDAMSDAVAWIASDGRIVRCNKALTRVVKKKFRDIIGRHCEEVIYGTSVPAEGCPIKQVMATHRRATALLHSGSLVYKVSADPLFDETGEFIGAVHIMSDVTVQERAEKVLKQLVFQQEAILDNIPDIAWLKDDQGRYLAANESFGRACGFTPAELIGKTDFDIWPQELARGYRADDLEVMQSKRRRRIEEPLADKERKIAWVETIRSPVLDEEGRVVGTTGIARDVTARRSGETALRHRDYVLSEAQRIARIGSWESNFRTGSVVWSEELHRVYGTSPSTFVPTAERFLRLVDPRDRKAVTGWIRDASAGKRLESLEFRVVRPDGAARWIRGSVEPLLDGAGTPIGAIGTGQDISERKRHEAELQASERKFRALFEAANDAIFIVDINGRYLDVNTVAHQRLGYTREQMLSMSVAQIDAPQFAAQVPERIREIIENGKAVFEAAHLRKDGTVMPVEISAVLTEHDGRKVIYSIVRDISARKQAEAAVAQSEERYRNLVDNASDMIQSVAPDGRFLYVNAAWRRVLGYDEADLRSLTLFDILHPECAGACADLFSQVISGVPADYFEAKLLAKNGRVVDVEGSANARFEGGRVISTHGIFHDVTERKRLREELYRISRDWEETFDTITDMVTVHDREFNIVRANAAAQKILGLPLMQTKPAKCFEFYHGTGCPPEGCPSCASLATGEPTVTEMFEPHLRRHLEVRAIPRLDAAGRVLGLIHVVRDITERRRAELIRKEQTLLAEFGMHIGNALNKEGSTRAILGACAQAVIDELGAAIARIWTLNPEGTALVLQASRGMSACRDDRDGLLPMDADLLVPTIARTRKPHLTNSVSGDPRVDQKAASREGLVSFAGYPLMVGGALVGVAEVFSKAPLSDFAFTALETVANNIALGIARTQGAEALKRYSAELAALSLASNNLLALSRLPEICHGICHFAEKIFGVELAWLGLIEAGGTAVHVAGCAGAGGENLRHLRLTVDDSPAGRGPTGRAIRSRKPSAARRDSPEFAPWQDAGDEQGFESCLAVPLISPAKPGGCIGALNLYSPHPDHFNANRAGLCQVFANQAAIAIENARLVEGLEDKIADRTLDIDAANLELQHINEELVQRRLEAESASRAKSDFLANMSHELRTPMNAIIGFTDLMIRGLSGPLTQKQREYLGDIHSSGRHLMSLINDILDLSKVEAGMMRLEMGEFDLAELVDRSLSLFKEKALKHRLALEARIEGEIGPVFGDERKIRQVIYNLVSNAVKFTPDGGSVVVTAGALSDEGREYAQVAVSDTGIGILPEDLDRLFLPFSQIEHHLTKEQEGTGLGLALSKSFVELHAGRIWVTSAPGSGSTFTFRIPLRSDAGAAR